jgi:cation transport ATPase
MSSFPAESTMSLRVKGLSYASRWARVEKAIRAVPGVASGSVNLATQRASAPWRREERTLPVLMSSRSRLRAGRSIVPPDRPPSSYMFTQVFLSRLFAGSGWGIV